MEDLIKPGDYVMIRRQAYTKLVKLKEKGTVNLGNLTIETDNVIGERYRTIFRMVSKTKKLHSLAKVEEISSIVEVINIEASGKDNRNIVDDGTSQTLTKDEINQFKDESLGAMEIVEKLVNSSTSFNSKTEFSQEKYLKKKEKKYFEYIEILRPNLRLLTEMYRRQDSSKLLELNHDNISQIIAYSNVQSIGNYLLYDSGTSGLIPAVILQSIGAETEGVLIHSHPGNECQKNAVLAMQFPREQLNRLINVNLYSVLRCFYQAKETWDFNEAESEEIPEKRIKLDDEETKKKPGWKFDNEKASRILKLGVDGVIIVCKEHPLGLVKEFEGFLKSSRSIVIYHLHREPLLEVYGHLKSRCCFISIRLIENFMRRYQVLPERTHPEVNMTTGGYILTAYKIS